MPSVDSRDYTFDYTYSISYGLIVVENFGHLLCAFALMDLSISANYDAIRFLQYLRFLFSNWLIKSNKIKSRNMKDLCRL